MECPLAYTDARRVPVSPIRRVLNPILDPRFHRVERHRACAEQMIMEGADVERVAELFFGKGAQFENFQLADLVSRRLSRPAYITRHLSLNVKRRKGGIVLEAGLGLFA